ncbi:aldehyde dehydrogenase family 3 member B1-like isoform X1 [Tursiops truncatus]|uniref:Aldehyde dehydrogenase family 3 member B1-like isoform X1 n=2 Tax=Tursiops truncatus TaxID=9739 RepID=A0A6J3RRL9_TURTR|nr:aldehyde dehydrogenase family 3 member B1-like isoform X1 [Tursiops truncatus]XP_033717164.1 aldehyde dehydrogenase family 3 member B1-like isoform X1 [Tursiops truncatus]XP_033717165.1 aldehyde dehydrogenase family 3 member B1-like isoform X1 [Tursiops truncatus]XP_033717166.1 aldehyde dehydrogenase family 3 member B1-like isoform X1 [Tursiops truncatus]XP_033717167.1 aldehyde dehydrogenase family 3 member B1-like isoform X1 [Tursiops truncatus]XP_033717168.1 aldehyde dehydrogenase family 
MSPGGPRVGKVVMAAAAKHLTPVTLELGGKNPCYVDDNCDPQTVANRVAFFRYFNSGQTCVAPDYILCSPEMQARLLPALQRAITRFYGEDPQSSPDLGRIISEKNFQRLRGLLSCGHVAIGGQTDESDRYIAPTVLVGVQETEPVMREEIFGPILPIMNVRSLDEAIEFIRCREKPLALYAFSNSSQVGLDRGGNNRGAQKGETGHLPFPGPLVRVRAAGASSVAIIQATGQRLPAHRCLAETGSSIKKLATRGWPTVCPGRGSSRPDDEVPSLSVLPRGGPLVLSRAKVLCGRAEPLKGEGAEPRWDPAGRARLAAMEPVHCCCCDSGCRFSGPRTPLCELRGATLTGSAVAPLEARRASSTRLCRPCH